MSLPDNVYLRIECDGASVPYTTSLTIKAKVNAARALSFVVADNEGLEQVRLGSQITAKLGIGSENDLLEFEGIVKIVQPGPQTTILAVDRIGHLVNSENTHFRKQDYVGEDLYYAARDACDYKGIDVSELKTGANLKATVDMPLWGWNTRKKFLDACFAEMVQPLTDSDHPKNTYLPWFYAILSENKMRFFQPDHLHANPAHSIFLSEDRQNIINDSMIAQRDTTNLINSCTVVSKDDDDIYYTYNDEHSIQTYGVHGRLIRWDSTNRNLLYEVARRYTERFKTPTNSYSVATVNNEWLALGALVKLVTPDFAEGVILPVKESFLQIRDKVESEITLGESRLSFRDLTKLLIEETQ
jgi:hypothetical protein|tara:strand:- start:53 stop:1123 length:1071 start_codon:yes stop_codon:yes gene_type:complete